MHSCSLRVGRCLVYCHSPIDSNAFCECSGRTVRQTSRCICAHTKYYSPNTRDAGGLPKVWYSFHHFFVVVIAGVVVRCCTLFSCCVSIAHCIEHNDIHGNPQGDETQSFTLQFQSTASEPRWNEMQKSKSERNWNFLLRGKTKSKHALNRSRWWWCYGSPFYWISQRIQQQLNLFVFIDRQPINE